MKKQMKELVGLLVEQGYVVTRNKKNHYCVRTQDGTFITTMASTPSEYRGWMNTLSTLRRSGFKDPWRH